MNSRPFRTFTDLLGPCCFTFVRLGRQERQDVVQPEPHHRCAGFQVGAMDLNDGGDAEEKVFDQKVTEGTIST